LSGAGHASLGSCRKLHLVERVITGMSRLPVFGCLLLLLLGTVVSEEVNAGHHQDGKSDLKGSSSDPSNSALASPDGPNVYDFHVGGWPFDVDFPEPSFLPGVTFDQYKNVNKDEEDEGHIKTSGEVEKRQIMDFSPPSRFPLLRGEDSGASLLTRRAEYGAESLGRQKKPAKRWQAYFSQGNNNLDPTDTWTQSYEMDENWQFAPAEEEKGTWVLVHDDYWDRRDRLRRNVNPAEEKSSSTEARRHDRSANPESWTVWHGGPKQDGSGKFVSAQLGWDATQVPGPGQGGWPPNQANWEGGPPTDSSVQRKPKAPRVIRNPKEPRKPRGKPRRPLKPDLLSFLKSLNPLAPKAQQKQSNAFQLEIQGGIRNAMDTMMDVIRAGDERQALFRQMMTPRRSDLMNVAKLLMATPAVMLLGLDFHRRIQEATNPQRRVLYLPRRLKRAA